MRKYSPDGGANQDQAPAKRARVAEGEGAANRLQRQPRFDRPQRKAKRHSWISSDESDSDEESDDDLMLPDGA